jgi:hypothetical protein
VKDPRHESRTEIEATLTRARSHATAVFYAGPEARPVAYGTDVSGQPRIFVTAEGSHARLETTWSFAQAKELFEALGVVLMAAEVTDDRKSEAFDRLAGGAL